MLELMVLGGVVVLVYKMAETQQLSGALWAAVAFGLSLASLRFPMPFLRVLIAGGVALVGMAAVASYYSRKG